MSDETPLSGVSRPDAPGSVADLKALVSTVFVKAAVLLVAATWIVFWGLVIRIHLLRQELLSAGVVALLFIVPAILGLIAYLDPLPDPIGWVRRYDLAIPRLT